MAVSQLDLGAFPKQLVGKSGEEKRRVKLSGLISTVRSSEGCYLTKRNGLESADAKQGCHLSARNRVLLSPILTHRRNPHFPAFTYQSTSDFGIESSELGKKLVLEEEDATASLVKDALPAASPSSHKDDSSIKHELIMLTLPAIGGQAIEPLAQLMETAYIGRLGPVELGSAGVSVAIFNNISKLFNIPLLSVATSFVAEDVSRNSVKYSDPGVRLDANGNGKPAGVGTRMELPSVSTALFLAVVIGIFEALALYFGSGVFLNLMGVPSESPMRATAHQFLSVRALGAPAIVLSLALQGVFRGLKDTKTPVLCLGLGNLSAVLFFPILMFYLQLGVAGAALSTVVSQYTVTFLMLSYLNKRVVLFPPKMGKMQFGGYVKSGGFLIGRTLSVLATMTLATSMAARQGPVAMAAHQICLQVWLAVSLLSDALATSGQALIASSFSKGEYRKVREATNFVLTIGFLAGVFLAVILGVSFSSLATVFAKDAEVLAIVRMGVLFVSASQPINALAFIFDGLHYGVSDFPYAACSMMLVGAISSAVLLYASKRLGLPGVWSGLTLFMALRMMAGFFRILSKNGPWWFLHGNSKRTEMPLHSF